MRARMKPPATPHARAQNATMITSHSEKPSITVGSPQVRAGHAGHAGQAGEEGQTQWQLRELAAPEAAPAAANLSRSPPTWVHQGQCEPMHDAQEVASPGFQKRRGPGPSQQVAGSGWSYAVDPNWAHSVSGGVGVRLRTCPLTGEVCQTDPPGDGACGQLGAAPRHCGSTISSGVAAGGRRQQHQPAPMRGRGPQSQKDLSNAQRIEI